MKVCFRELPGGCPCNLVLNPENILARKDPKEAHLAPVYSQGSKQGKE
jgi:hypothetical protein